MRQERIFPTLLTCYVPNERIILNRKGKNIAVIISLEDLELLESLEDNFDNIACDKALNESNKRIPYDVVKKELGLI